MQLHVKIRKTVSFSKSTRYTVCIFHTQKNYCMWQAIKHPITKCSFIVLNYDSGTFDVVASPYVLHDAFEMMCIAINNVHTYFKWLAVTVAQY